MQKLDVLPNTRVEISHLVIEKQAGFLDIEISVIIATRKPGDSLTTCLSALAPQTRQNGGEIVVVESLSAPIPASVKSAFPEVNFVTCTGADSLAEMRATGIRAAHGEIIAMTQAYCVPAHNWLQMHRDAHVQLAASAIGGAVIIRPLATIAERVALLCEYGKFNSNRCAGPASFLASSNISYKKHDLLRVMEGDYWETDLQKKLSKSGRGLWYFPEIAVVHHRRCTPSKFLLEKFNYSRYFAARRFDHKGIALLYAIGCALLPAIVLIRLLATFSENGKLYSEFFVCVPFLIAISITWAAGEFVGYTFGSGNSEKYFG